MASNLKRNKRTVGKRLTDIQNRVSTIEKRPAAKALSDAAVATTNLAPGAVGGWMVDADALYIGVKTASGSYSPAGSMTISSDGHISAHKFRLDSNGDAVFAGVLNAPSGSIGGWTIGTSGLYSGSGFSSVSLYAGTAYTDFSPRVSSNAKSGTSYRSAEFGNYSIGVDYQVWDGIPANPPSVYQGSRLDETGLIVSSNPGTTDSSFLYNSMYLNGTITVTAGNSIKAETSFITTGSTVTARVTQEVAGYDYLARPTSLRELKENIEDIEDALGILSTLRPRTYNFRVDAFSPIDPYTQEPWTEEAKEIAQLNIKYGLIIDEVMSARPELISYSHERTDVDPAADGGYFDFSSWNPTMWEDADVLVLCVKAIQELAMRVADLESKS